MINRIHIVLLFLALSVGAWAERVPESKAREVAQQVLSSMQTLRSTVSPVLSYQAPSGLRGDGGADYYVYTPDQGQGFVIVSGDDIAMPVLGYSMTDPFSADHMPLPMRKWLDQYQEELAHATSTTAPEEVATEWGRYMKGDFRMATGTVLETPTWNQGEPYNRMTPEIDGQHTLTGCVATAMGIIMCYHKYPSNVISAPASNSYRAGDQMITTTIDYSEPYDWEHIRDSYPMGGYTDTEAMAVSKLLYHCGANLQMSYGLQESTSFMSDVGRLMVDIFGYSPSLRPAMKEQMTWDAWKAMIRQDIDEGLPIIYDGNSEDSGHAFICDGYADDYFHFNWGWGGYSNGYYVLSALKPSMDDYTADQLAFFQIKPTREGSPTTPALTLSQAKYTAEGHSIRNEFSICFAGLNETTCYFGLGVVDNHNEIVLSPNLENCITSSFLCFFNFYGYYELNLNRPLQADERVVMLGSYDASHWEIMPTGPEAEVGYGIDGPIPPVGDETTDPVSPVNMSVYYNSFAMVTYFEAGDLDNTVDHRYSIGGMEYELNEPRDIKLTYRINEYDRWKGKVAIYRGDSWDLQLANTGELLEIDNEGCFVYKMDSQTGDETNCYRQYLKFLSSERGTLTFTLTATEEGVPLPAYTSEPMTVHFVNPSDTEWDDWSLEATVGKRITLKPKLTELDPLFEDDQIDAEIMVSGLRLDDYNLYLSNGEPVTMRESFGDPYFTFSEMPVPMWRSGQPIDHLIFEPKKVAEEGKNPFIYLVANHNGHEIPGDHYSCGLRIKASDTANADIEDSRANAYGLDGELVIHTTQDADITIHTLLGQRIYETHVTAGDYRFPLPSGIYMVCIGDETFKVKI